LNVKTVSSGRGSGGINPGSQGEKNDVGDRMIRKKKGGKEKRFNRSGNAEKKRKRMS